jgi:hypothetical protein
MVLAPRTSAWSISPRRIAEPARCRAYPEAEQAESRMRNRWKTRIINIHTSVENERWTLQIESEGDSVGTDGNTFSDTIMVVDFVTVILQLGGGGEELTEVNSGVGATVVDTGINQSLERNVRITAKRMIGKSRTW